MNSSNSASGRVSLALPLQMFAGLVIGLVLALVWPSFAASLQPIGTPPPRILADSASSPCTSLGFCELVRSLLG